MLRRTSEGRIRAKANGVKFGPKFKLTKHQRDEAIARRENGGSLTSIGRVTTERALSWCAADQTNATRGDSTQQTANCDVYVVILLACLG
jgi:hypothetical protein